MQPILSQQANVPHSATWYSMFSLKICWSSLTFISHLTFLLNQLYSHLTRNLWFRHSLGPCSLPHIYLCMHLFRFSIPLLWWNSVMFNWVNPDILQWERRDLAYHLCFVNSNSQLQFYNNYHVEFTAYFWAGLDKAQFEWQLVRKWLIRPVPGVSGRAPAPIELEAVQVPKRLCTEGHPVKIDKKDGCRESGSIKRM